MSPATDGTGWTAPNRAWNLRTRWEDGAVTYERRVPTASAGSDDAGVGDWELVLRLTGFGRLGSMEVVGPVDCESVDRRRT